MTPESGGAWGLLLDDWVIAPLVENNGANSRWNQIGPGLERVRKHQNIWLINKYWDFDSQYTTKNTENVLTVNVFELVQRDTNPIFLPLTQFCDIVLAELKLKKNFSPLIHKMLSVLRGGKFPVIMLTYSDSCADITSHTTT